MACACDASKEWWRYYVGKSPQECMTIKYACPMNTTPFSNCLRLRMRARRELPAEHRLHAASAELRCPAEEVPVLRRRLLIRRVQGYGRSDGPSRGRFAARPMK